MGEVKKTAKLLRFEEAIKNMAKKESEDIVESMISESEKRIKETEVMLDEKYKTMVAEHKRKIKSDGEKAASKAAYEAGRAVLVRRNELVEELFGEISQRLSDFASGEEYGGYVEKCFARASAVIPFYSGVSVFCAEKDIGRVSALAEKNGIKAEISKEIILGGISFFYPEQNKIIDITLDKSLENEREAFTGNSEMQL